VIILSGRIYHQKIPGVPHTLVCRLFWFLDLKKPMVFEVQRIFDSFGSQKNLRKQPHYK